MAGAGGAGGCLPSTEDTDSTTQVIGGTMLVGYAVDPGSVSLGLYPSDANDCQGTPAVGPTTIDATAGSRTLVFAYGTDAQAVRLLVLPIDG
jgi:hypothetical protein